MKVLLVVLLLAVAFASKSKRRNDLCVKQIAAKSLTEHAEEENKQFEENHAVKLPALIKGVVVRTAEHAKNKIEPTDSFTFTVPDCEASKSVRVHIDYKGKYGAYALQEVGESKERVSAESEDFALRPGASYKLKVFFNMKSIPSLKRVFYMTKDADYEIKVTYKTFYKSE